MNVLANGVAATDAMNSDKRSPASTTASDSSEVFRFAMAVRENARLRDLDESNGADRRPHHGDLLSAAAHNKSKSDHALLHVHVNNGGNNNHSNYSSSSSGIASHQTGLSNDIYYSSNNSQPWYEQAELWPSASPQLSPNQQQYVSQDDLRSRPPRPQNTAAWESSSGDLHLQPSRQSGQGHDYDLHAYNQPSSKPTMVNGVRYYPEVNPSYPAPTGREQQHRQTAHAHERPPTQTHDAYWNAYLQNKQQKQHQTDDDYAARIRNECVKRIQPTKAVPALSVPAAANSSSVNSVNNGIVRHHQASANHSRTGAMHHTSSDADDSTSDSYIEYRVVPNGTNPIGALSVKNVSQLNTPLLHPSPSIRLNGLHGTGTQKNSILTSSRSSVASVLETDLDTGEERDVVILTEANGSLSFLPVEVSPHASSSGEGHQGHAVNGGDSFNFASDFQDNSLRQSAVSVISNYDSLSSNASLTYGVRQSPNTSLNFGVSTSTPNSRTHSLKKNRNLADKVRSSTRIRIKPLDDIADAIQEVERIADKLEADSENLSGCGNVREGELNGSLVDNEHDNDELDGGDRNALTLWSGLPFELQSLSEPSTLSRRSRRSSQSGASTPTESARDRILRLLEDVVGADDNQSLSESVATSKVSESDPFKELVDDQSEKDVQDGDELAHNDDPPKFSYDSDREDDLQAAAIDDTAIMVKCNNPKCDLPELSLADARATFKSCHNCYAYYCGRECRKAHWERHKRRCVFSRLKSAAKRVMRKIYEDGGAVFEELSRIARMGYIRYGRGCVLILFTSVDVANDFLDSSQCLMSKLEEPPVFLPQQNLKELRVFVDQKSELDEACKSYNPEIKLVVEVVILGSETSADKSLSSSMTSSMMSCNQQQRRFAVKKCAKLRLIQQMRGRVNGENRDEDAETLILTALPNPEYVENMAGRKARQLCFINIQQQLRNRGVNLRRQYPAVYGQLCAYVADEQTFVPIALTPRNGHTGKRFMCLIMPDSEPDPAWIDRADLLDSIGLDDSLL